MKNTDASSNGVFTGFNSAAYAMIISQTMLGLSVSFVLKYVDNIAKCFVAAVSMLRGVAPHIDAWRDDSVVNRWHSPHIFGTGAV